MSVRVMSATVKPSNVPNGLPTLEERERLHGVISPRLSAFTARPRERLAKLSKPTSTLELECRQFVKTTPGRFPKLDASLQYRLWLEAGKHGPPFPPNPDANYNSNVWRNFRENYGFVTDADDCDMNEIIAAIYPLNIPPPSRVGDHTFHKYIAETKLFADPKQKLMALKRSKTDIDEFLRLKLRSEQRNPMLDERGNILPPEKFKRYVHKFIAPPPPKPQTPDSGVYKIDVFGQIARSKTQPSLWKLTHRLNHPAYAKFRDAIARRKELQEQMNQGGQLNIEWGKRMQESRAF